MERIAPPPKDAGKLLHVPSMNNALEAAEAAGSLLRAVSEGYLTPIEITLVMGLIDSYRRTLEFTDIETRIMALETNLAHFV